jgi:hypothetical protein
MCINCNLVAPIQHEICNLLGIPYNLYGMVSNTCDILNNAIINESMANTYDIKNEQTKSMKLYKYLIEHDLLHHITTLITNEKYTSVVEQSFINYVMVKYFTIDWKNDPDVVEQLNVPIELLSSEPERFRKCIGKVTYKQVELIPDEIIQKYKVTSDKAIAYGLILLPNQIFYIKVDEIM